MFKQSKLINRLNKVYIITKQRRTHYVKSKQYIETSVENAVDKIVFKMKDGQIDLTTAVAEVKKLDNLEMVGITEDNVEEVLLTESKS